MKYKIDLKAKKETPLLEHIIYFSLNYLRYIIVITQLVVIGVFFYRFQIDQSIIDLKDSVDQKKEIVQIVLPLLNEAQRIDTKTKDVEIILKKQTTFQAMSQYLLSVFPQSINLNTMEIDADSIKLTGVSFDAKQLQNFFALLKKDKKFSAIQFDTIKRTETGYEFSMELNKFVN